MRYVNITYFVHGTTTDNERRIASGWNNCELSDAGKDQSIKLKEQTKDRKFDFIFCSDLKRAVDSAIITFGNKVPIIKDERLREINYGDLTKYDSRVVESLMLKHIEIPFPNGESYKDVEERIRNFLADLLKKYNYKRVAIVGHRATQLSLEVIINKKTWERTMKEDWRLKNPKEWKPGWDYRVKDSTL